MTDKLLIKKAFGEMKKEQPKFGECPNENDLANFAEGIMDEKELERIEEHLVSCSKCCDYAVSLNKVINFSAEERLPEVPDKQMKKVSDLVEDGEKDSYVNNLLSSLAEITRVIKEFFNFGWITQPMPIAVRSGALAFLVLLIVSTTFLYYQQSAPLGVTMEVMGKTSVIATRGMPEKTVEKIIGEGDILYSNDYCRISFELDHDAYAYVLHYDSTRKLHQLYPDPATKTHKKVKGKSAHTIPEREDDWFQLDDKRGTETFFILASNKPLTGFEETFASIKGLSREEVVKVFQSKAAIVKVLSFKHQ